MVDFIAEVLKENDVFKESEIILSKNRKIRKYPKNVERKITLGISLGDMLQKSTNSKGEVIFKLN